MLADDLGIAPLAQASTGVPAAIASTSTIPNCSSQPRTGRLPRTMQEAAAKRAGICSYGIVATKLVCSATPSSCA